MFLLILLFLTPVFSNEEFFHHDEDLGRTLTDYIETLSVFKPIKCSANIPNTHNEDNDNSVWFRSRSCELNEMWTPFEFSGSVNELNQLTGPGKFSLQKKNTYQHTGNFSTCIEFPKVFEKQDTIYSIIGTFVNGTVHGNAKIKFTKGTTSILTFKHGVPHGLNRVFDSNKTLISAEIMSKGSPVGYSWRRMDDSNYLIDYRHTNDTIKDQKADLHTTLLFDKEHNRFLGGTFPRFIENLYHVYKPKSLSFQSDSDECIKNIQWEKSQPAKDLIFSLDFMDFVPDSLPDFFLNSKNLSPPKRLLQFKKYLIQNKTTVGHLFRHKLTPVNEETKVPFLSDIIKLKEGHKAYEALLFGTKVNISHYRGLLDVNGRFHGNTWLQVDENNQIKDPVLNATISYLALQFLHGQLLDENIIIGLSDLRFGYTKLVSGTLHGPLIIHGSVPILPVKEVKAHMVHDTGSTIFNYDNGVRTGSFWIGMFGLGALTGVLNEDGHVSGDRISYLYPDMETSYVGRFEKNIMREAYLGDVDSATWDQGMVPSLTFKMSKEETRPFYYQPPTNDSIGSGPDILDPYDAKRVYLSDAGEFGEGVIAKVDMEVGDIACLYNYHIYYPNDRKALYESCTSNTTKTKDERRHCVKYSLSIQYLDATMNVPPEKDLPDMFLPTLGMKLNHKFYESHASFMDFESPRWGIVSSIALYYKPIKAGEQLFVDYGYRVRGEFPSDFPWFWELKDKVDGEIKEKLRREKAKSLKKKKKKGQTKKSKST